jgi:hypothetical protein
LEAEDISNEAREDNRDQKHCRDVENLDPESGPHIKASFFHNMIFCR